MTEYLAAWGFLAAVAVYMVVGATVTGWLVTKVEKFLRRFK